MKTPTFFSVLAASLFSIAAFGQTAQSENSAQPKTLITFATQQEKDARIKVLKEKIKIDAIDATFPADVLKKEKEELAETKKAKLTGTKNETLKSN